MIIQAISDRVNACFADRVLISPNLSSSQLKLDQPLSLGIMASGSGTNFEAVASAIADGQLNAEIKVLIYNNPDAQVRSRAEKYNIPTILINHREYQKREDLDEVIVTTFQEYGVRWVIMAGWMRVVTQVLIDAFPNRLINIHPSLLPSFKGIRAIEQALAAKVKITGCTVHLVSLEVDSGLILMQAAVPILPDDTPETLHCRVQVQEHNILPKAIALAAMKEMKKLE
ncbi:formyltetrahydrofolate-dependent phosphoribosylglycinamide formyltransferase [Stanieria cyanosphaera PCC 7437]|uniref:Phosphoribosylglycinamide formyltransferase n=1 Tax=Stanieria cyanosphaera (strain ATCC 29371 / PCC 7437) TaxID=111780 RepID=K9XW82_STAC7|nr:phosphoribosylglycinamide formyltransferase [Stanieria cyanosphaera]AFZ35927.1 formyltetrahydrofolate-dependent phosphoribosylglycinamide formyltransferase [Stanieria cyanosphaera PCC 7437]